MGKAQRGGIVAVERAKRRVHRYDQTGLHRVADTLHGVFKAVHTYQRVVTGSVGGIERDLYAVKTCLIELSAQGRGQCPAVGIQPCDKPLCRIHQLHQILPQSRLAAGKGHLRDIRFA